MKIADQWNELKAKAGKGILLVRLGDWYEAFYADAAMVSSVLNLPLTKRGEVPVTGFPVFHLYPNLKKLNETWNHTVAVTEDRETFTYHLGAMAKSVEGAIDARIGRIMAREVEKVNKPKGVWLKKWKPVTPPSVIKDLLDLKQSLYGGEDPETIMATITNGEIQNKFL